MTPDDPCGLKSRPNKAYASLKARLHPRWTKAGYRYSVVFDGNLLVDRYRDPPASSVQLTNVTDASPFEKVLEKLLERILRVRMVESNQIDPRDLWKARAYYLPDAILTSGLLPGRI